MSKIAIVTDSNSGITNKEAEELGLEIIPMPFQIDDVEYFDGVNLTHEEFYEKLLGESEIFTSQPVVAVLMDLWDQLLKEYDEVVSIPMSSSLSNSCETALSIARDYDGKVQVVDNRRISVTQRQSVLDAIELKEQGKSALEIKTILEEKTENSSVYITVDTLKYLKKGGRITPAAAMLGELLKIKPVLQIQGGKLDSYEKARTMKKARQIMIDAIKHDIETKFDLVGKGENVHLSVAHSNDLQLAQEFKEQIQEVFPKHNIYIAPLSLSIACHIGPGALAIACSKKI